MIEVREYDLPDVKLLNADSEKPYEFMVWQPESVAIILGASNKPENSLFIDKILEDDVHVFKRHTGGESVILTQNTAIISLRTFIDRKKKSTEYFADINKRIINALSVLGIDNLGTDGISDIKIGDKKILGSSMKRTQYYVFYHAVLNVSESTELMEKYLKFPLKTPEYRAKRSHSEFVTSINAEGYKIPTEKIISELNKQLESAL